MQLFVDCVQRSNTGLYIVCFMNTHCFLQKLKLNLKLILKINYHCRTASEHIALHDRLSRHEKELSTLRSVYQWEWMDKPILSKNQLDLLSKLLNPISVKQPIDVAENGASQILYKT